MGWSIIKLNRRRKKRTGFTVVEIFIIIVVIAILAVVVIVSYNGLQQRSRSVLTKSNMNGLQKLIQKFQVEYGSFPVTTHNPKANWRAADVLTDSNCPNGSSQADWIPDISSNLPQSNPNIGEGVDGARGCYVYVSDGVDYVISAWNMVTPPQSSTLYRRLGFRELHSDSSTLFYTCNVSGVGGVSGGSYDISQDYYKHSYTISNITDCDETPPPGA